MVRMLCTPAAAQINGGDFFVGGEEIAMLSPPVFQRTIVCEGGWTVDMLDRFGATLGSDLPDPFRVENPFANDD